MNFNLQNLADYLINRIDLFIDEPQSHWMLITSHFIGCLDIGISHPLPEIAKFPSTFDESICLIWVQYCLQDFIQFLLIVSLAHDIRTKYFHFSLFLYFSFQAKVKRDVPKLYRRICWVKHHLVVARKKLRLTNIYASEPCKMVFFALCCKISNFHTELTSITAWLHLTSMMVKRKY